MTLLFYFISVHNRFETNITRTFIKFRMLEKNVETAAIAFKVSHKLEKKLNVLTIVLYNLLE